MNEYAGRPGTPETIVGVGVSYAPLCGIRDYWRMLVDHLEQAGCAVRSVWWERDDGTLLRALTGIRRWSRALDGIEPCTKTALLWNYSVFGYGVRGIPLLAPLAAWRLHHMRLPITLVLHEFGHPWWWPGWRGRIFALTHRAALFAAVLVSSEVIVTTQTRADWLRSRRWLPRRPLMIVPVFATVPPLGGPNECSTPTIGVFGYGARRMRADVVLGALARLNGELGQVKLTLLGGSGRSSAEGERWVREARRFGCEAALEFTGPLDLVALSGALRDANLLVFPDEAGASSRKTTLAAALAHGQCVIALTGEDEWADLQEERAIVVVPPDAGDLARQLASLLHDDGERQRQGERAKVFYQDRMAPSVVAERILSFASTGSR